MPRTEFNSGAGNTLACLRGLRLGFLGAQANMLFLQWGKDRVLTTPPDRSDNNMFAGKG